MHFFLKQTCAIFRWLLYWLCEFLGLRFYLQMYLPRCIYENIATFYGLLRHPLLRSVLSIKVYKRNLKVSDLRQESRTTVGFSVKQDGLTRWQNTQCTTSISRGGERSCDWCLQPLEWTSKTIGCKERNGLNWNLVSSFIQFTVNRAKAK